MTQHLYHTITYQDVVLQLVKSSEVVRQMLQNLYIILCLRSCDDVAFGTSIELTTANH